MKYDEVPGFPNIKAHGGGNIAPGAIFLDEILSAARAKKLLGNPGYSRVNSGAYEITRTIDGTVYRFIRHPGDKSISVSPVMSLSGEQRRILHGLMSDLWRGHLSHMSRKKLAAHFKEKVDSVAVKQNPGKRWVNIDPLMAQIIMDWHGGQSSVEYSVASRYYAGLYTWDISGSRTLMKLSPDEISMVKRVAAEEEKSYSRKRRLTTEEGERLAVVFSVLYENSLDDIGEGPEKD